MNVTHQLSPVKSVEMSSNRKLSTNGRVSVTMTSQASCPKTCPFFNHGCYAQAGPMGIHTSKLNKSEITDDLEIAKIHAEEVKRLSGVWPLRLNIVGDTKTDEAAKLLSEACSIYTAKHGQVAWAYTHSHETQRESWGEVSILRSCETLDQVKKAHEDGFAAAMVVSEYPTEKAYELGDGFIGIPCPQTTGKKPSCAECGLCKHDKRMHARKHVVLFAAHGARKKSVQRMLSSLKLD